MVATNPKSNQYFLFVDILKGIAILLIIYGHIIPGAIPMFTDYALTFHIPLFFFVSGLLFNNEKYANSFGKFFTKRFKGLVMPFFYLSVIVAALYFIFTKDYSKFITSLLSDGWGGYALWFIPVLICVELLYFPIANAKKSIRIICIFLSAILSFFSAKYFGYVSHNILLTFCGIFFYGIGNTLRKEILSIVNMSFVAQLIILISGIVLSLCYFPITEDLPEWFINNIPSPIYYLTPFGAIASLISLSQIIAKYFNKHIITFFANCGKYSLILLAFHQVICLLLQGMLPSKITILIMIMVLIGLVYFIPRYAPWLIGKKYEQIIR